MGSTSSSHSSPHWSSESLQNIKISSWMWPPMNKNGKCWIGTVECNWTHSQYKDVLLDSHPSIDQAWQLQGCVCWLQCQQAPSAQGPRALLWREPFSRVWRMWGRVSFSCTLGLWVVSEKDQATRQAVVKVFSCVAIHQVLATNFEVYEVQMDWI